MWIRLAFLIVLACAPRESAVARADDVRPPEFQVLASVGPWSEASRAIAYRGRVWFVNSVRGRNHNSADIWSLEPATGVVRYERHLFSQDAGAPVVHRGLLYWPHEDARASLGWGAVSVTDGERWQDLVIPSAQIFHVHGLAGWRDGLLAVTSAWRAGFQFSDDGGLDWTPLYDHPTPQDRVSRMPRFAAGADQVVGLLRDAGTDRLAVWNGDALAEIAGWAPDMPAWGFVFHAGAPFWIGRDTQTGHAVRTLRDGAAVRLDPPAPDWRPVALADAGVALWALTRHTGGGGLWRSLDGATWTPAGTVTGGRPTALAAAGDAIVVTGSAEAGGGIVWGPATLGLPPGEGPPPALPEPAPMTLDERERAALAAELESALAAPASFENHGRDVLRAPVFRLSRAGPAGGAALARLLDAPVAAGDASMLGGAVMVPRRDLARWILLWGIGLAGAGPVPTALLDEKWSVPENASAKYFHPLPMALWAISRTGQGDDATVEALIARLAAARDPDWLTGDVVGALTAVTGERFGYDAHAWREWWKER